MARFSFEAAWSGILLIGGGLAVGLLLAVVIGAALVLFGVTGGRPGR